ncbi:glutathione S-transferase N-terminal domain-containing protein [Myxococcus sp. Y35]|uniref:glutathione S-transferase N-terminal domain-containing protein n=1 Tax=Pseudomyxococcus flavus TaxID=3115648 RepID=UPI003CE8CFD7
MRDLRVRWALEEAGLPYRVQGVPFKNRGDLHFAHHPFGQVPWLTDGDISIFESGAILLHLGERSQTLIPSDPRGLDWAGLLRRTFALDVFACLRSGGRQRVLAYVKEAGGVRAALEHLGLPTASAHLAPARGPPQSAWC